MDMFYLHCKFDNTQNMFKVPRYFLLVINTFVVNFCINRHNIGNI